MRYFFLLLLILALCTSGRAQLQITTNLGLVDDFCSGADPDPNNDCINIPSGNNTLTYRPGEDGDLLFTYRIVNQSGKFISQVLATDSRFGTFFPTQTLMNNIPPGATVPLNVIYDALTIPETVEGVVTLTVEYANGSSEQVTGTYELKVVAPEVDVEFSLVRKIDACPTDVIPPNCPGQNYGNFTLSVGATDTIVTRFNWTNAGVSTYDQSVLTAQDGEVLASTGFDQDPDQTLISAQYLVAPSAPGTYNWSQTITVTDFAGNNASETVNYTIIVEAPEVGTEFSLVRKIDACPTDVIPPNCSGQNYGNFTLSVGATDTIVTRFNWTNTGLGTYDESVLTAQDGEVLASTGFNQVSGQTLISAQYLVAPSAPGTYNWSQTITVTDFGGNSTAKTINYTIIVEAPQVSTDFSLVRKIDACPTDVIPPNCSGQNYGNFTLSVGATDTIVTRFNWTNTGLGTYDQSELIAQDGEVLANTGFNQVSGQTLISAQYLVAPSAPGTYNWSQTITVTDFGGNSTAKTINYTIIVEAPQVSTDFSLVRKKDACPGDVIPPNCPGQNYGNFALTVGAADTIVTRFNWTNTGLGTYDQSELITQDGEVLASTGFNQVSGQTLISAQYLVSPDAPGTYNWSQTITVTDFGGNSTAKTINYTITVDCSILDDADPVAVCRNRTYSIVEGETLNINAGAINNGSFDGCGDLAGGAIDISSFTCDDEGPNTVTLTVGDLVGNSSSCTSTVTINVLTDIYEGNTNNCVSTTTQVTAGQNWWRLEAPNGQVVAEVIIGSNTNIKAVRTEVFKDPGMIDNVEDAVFLSKRVSLTLLDGNNNVVQPNNEPLYVRLYYTEAELAALLAADPTADFGTLTVVKTDGTDCGNGYTGLNATGMNSIIKVTGCDNQHRYFEFFTGSFSTFYLFPTDRLLPVELSEFTAEALPKQKVQLDWTTLTESGNSHFDVERSADGRSFEKLGVVAGAGDSYEERSYSFTDEFALAGANYYRLRQVDLDGTETLSEVRRVNVEGNGNIRAFPNPGNNELRLSGFEGGQVVVIAVSGREVRRAILGQGQALPVADLVPGIYLVRAGGQTLRWVKR